MDKSPIQSDAEIVHGQPCFTGTRVPVRNLFDLLARDRTIEYFLQQFPTVRREQVLAVLRMAKVRITGDPHDKHRPSPSL